MLKSFFSKQPPSSSNPQQQALQHIQVKLQQAMSSWKKRLDPRARNNLKGNPWFLLVGSPNSGKTTLLANNAKALCLIQVFKDSKPGLGIN